MQFNHMEAEIECAMRRTFHLASFVGVPVSHKTGCYIFFFISQETLAVIQDVPGIEQCYPV